MKIGFGKRSFVVISKKEMDRIIEEAIRAYGYIPEHVDRRSKCKDEIKKAKKGMYSVIESLMKKA